MKAAILAFVILAIAAASQSPVRAQAPSEADRLREAVRSMTTQIRSLEDQRTANQAKLAQTEREKQRADQASELLRRQLKDAEDRQQQMIAEFNRRLGERDQVLERWRSSFGQAADVARDKEGQRAKLEGEATEYKARARSCEAKNIQLMKISKEIVAGYRDLNLGKAFVITEPLIGIGRVEHQNKVQDFQDRISDQDLGVPRAVSEPAKQQDKTTDGATSRPSASQDKSNKDARAADSKSRARPGTTEGQKP
jgi:hypothetical protein